MNFANVLLIPLLTVGLSSAASARNFCVSNIKEFSEKKNEIPPVFHNLPEKSAYFTIDKFVVTGGLQVRAHEKGHFVFEGYFRKGLSYYEDVSDIKEICFKDNTVVVELGKGKESYKALIENSGISIDNYLISSNNSSSSYDKIKHKIQTTRANQMAAQHNQGAN